MLAQRVMVQNIINTYNQATPAQIEDGHLWYITANAIITDIMQNCGNKDITVEHVAVAMAHLSPRTMWSRNVLACERVCNYGERPSGIIGRGWDMAYDALEVDNPLSTLNGPKVKRFARNLLGDTECVTVDVWGLRVAGQNRVDEIKINRKGVYEKVERAYIKAADILGIAAPNLQAICWIVVRNGRKG